MTNPELISFDSLLENGRSLLESQIIEAQTPEPGRLDLVIGPSDLPQAVQTLVDNHWGYLAAITGLDRPESSEVEALYHFCSGPAVLTLRVRVPYAEPALPTICGVIPSATLYEREFMEMFGVQVTGTPDPQRLFLPDDWPEGVYPLRKSFNPQEKVPQVKPKANGDNAGRYIVPIGPQHPALKEPGHFEFTVNGEIVTGASVRLGYVHRGIEKACEERTWTQAMYLLERVCGICSNSHAYAYVLGVEKLAQVEAPERAQAIRELVAGLERIHSHLLWLGVAAHEAGFDTLFMYSWRDRETVMDLLEGLTGNRVNYSANLIGGVKFDVDDEQRRTILAGLDYLEERCRHYLDVVSTDAAFLQRTRGVGTMPREQAELLGVVGPTARASGVDRDIRVEAPYGSYRRFPVSIVIEHAGDLEAKFVVRVKEMLVSISTLRALLDNLPPGELVARVPRRIPAGETISRVEAPRGELFYFIKSSGGDKPERVKVRTPSICNFGSVIHTAVGHQFADMPMLLAGIDPCFSCNDRMIVVRKK